MIVFPTDTILRRFRDVVWLHRHEQDPDVVLEALVDSIDETLARASIVLVDDPRDLGDELLIFSGGHVEPTASLYAHATTYTGELPLWTTRDFADDLDRVYLLPPSIARARRRFHHWKGWAGKSPRKWWVALGPKKPAHRWIVARLVNRHPRTCWASLVSWALDDHRELDLRSCTVGELCSSDARRNGSCYCGKVRS